MLSNAFQAGALPRLLGSGTKLSSRALLGGAELGTQGLEEGYQTGFSNEMLGRDYSYNPVDWATDPRYSEQAQAVKEGIA